MIPPAERRPLLLEALALTAVAAGGTLLLVRLDQAWLKEHRDLFIAGVWLYLPLWVAWQRRVPLSELALSHGPLGPSLGWVLLWVLISYPPFYLVWGLVQIRYLGRVFQPEWPAHFGQIVAAQFLVVALPEEIFFRGYLQGRLNQVFGRPWRLWGAPLGPGLFLTALLFMLCHLLIRITWVRIAIFFPALLFGWMRERTGSLLAPTLFHGLSNLTFLLAQAALAGAG